MPPSSLADECHLDPPASADLLAVIDRWHAFMRGADPDALDELLHDDVVLYSPVAFTPPRGKAIVVGQADIPNNTVLHVPSTEISVP